MKLTDLNPQFIGCGGEGIFNADMTPAEERFGVGVMFDCPCGCKDRIFVGFDLPLDGKGPWNNDRYCWKRTGDSFENLTLTPSILRTKSYTDKDGVVHDFNNCGWHGFITNGEVMTV